MISFERLKFGAQKPKAKPSLRDKTITIEGGAPMVGNGNLTDGEPSYCYT